MSNSTDRLAALGLLRGTARVIAAAGLAVDAYVHAKLAGQYDAVSASVSQGNLFRLEAGLAALAALLVLIWRHLIVDAFAWLVAAGGLAALMVYRYIDVGAFGPFPDMYEPIWSYDKKLAAIVQAVTIVAVTFLLVTRRRRLGMR
ncbi:MULTISPECIES: hypothetical protein [unclassified Streptomyces]|uniref:hypothetical protein n=1 Tax=unclassified Streptomyces TaxID=2593676 RepID=UPI002E289D06|nr:hypothetical protein [Streptomyces sp. NBC_00223]